MNIRRDKIFLVAGLSLVQLVKNQGVKGWVLAILGVDQELWVVRKLILADEKSRESGNGEFEFWPILYEPIHLKNLVFLTEIFRGCFGGGWFNRWLQDFFGRRKLFPHKFDRFYDARYDYFPMLKFYYVGLLLFDGCLHNILFSPKLQQGSG